MNICIISDEKQGHLSQTRGLAEALQQLAASRGSQKEQRIIEWSICKKSFWQRFFYKGEEAEASSLDLVLCAGHSTHWAALSVARHYKCPCMVCMKPSIPCCLFDLALIPEHDLKENKSCRKKIFPTKGALNNINPDSRGVAKHILFLIGGPSRDFEWDGEMLINQIELITRSSRLPMVLTTSRRTPEDFAFDVRQACPSIHVEPFEQTAPEWIRQHLNNAREVWVTQDSVSMVYEALSSGAPVGILDMPRKEGKQNKLSRVTSGLQKILSEGYATSFTYWAKNKSFTQNPPLHEAQRAAEHILKHFPQLLSS